MSEPVARQRPMIDLDEFERRLRWPAASPPPPRNDDPLAELARLVGDEKDPYRGMFQEELRRENHEERSSAPIRPVGRDRLAGSGTGMRAERPHDPPRVAASAPPRMPLHIPPRVAEPVEAWGGRAPVPAAPVPAARAAARGNGLPASRNSGPNPAQNLGGNFAAIEAGLRGSIQPEFRSSNQNYAPDFQPHYDQGWNEDLAPQEKDLAPEEDDADWLAQAQKAAPRQPGFLPEPPRSRRLLYVTAAIILVGIGGIGATFAIKRSPVSPQQIAMIKAATSPAKIEAPEPATNAGAKIIQDASVLDKTPQPLPVGVVNRAEQPVDLAQAEALSVQGAAPQSAASVPVPQPPAEADTAGQGGPAPSRQGRSGGIQMADVAPGESFGLGGMIQSKKVRTVAVRPDGTIISDDVVAEMPPATPAAADANPAAASANDARPEISARARPFGAGAAEREALVADQSESNGASDTAVRSNLTTRAKPLDSAEGAAGPTDTGSIPSSSGTFAVQLAAPATEAEARHAITKFMHRYPREFRGHPLKWYHAKVSGKSVYRVRVAGLSKSAAATLCQSLKAKGGSCFVAPD